RLPRDPELAARLHAEGDAAHGGDVAGTGAVGHRQVPDQEVVVHRRSRNRGLSTPSRARPHMVKDSATTATATPGGTMYHQMPELMAPALRASSMMPPQEIVPGVPSPRNARVASIRMASATSSVVW